ncbi:peptide methionine sulfoxide reductase msrA/msrB [Ereboglobus sp. PH5-10]|nr:bifunctional methionine sulfoxide reductase B/A protein [Ereboglobus sp. PH5-10]MDF9827531.1 peptide methionine sulfoxide reductase msrA/msrB [Ereboglobus sp. PH5-10]
MKIRLHIWIFLLLAMTSNAEQPQPPIKTNPLTPEEARVILHKGTEQAFSGKYYKFGDKGVYTCKHCDAILFRSSDKFDSECGWPSFDNDIPGAVKKTPDADGRRTEIVCNRCGGHLGHVFHGERFTAKNTRYCVNSISLNFVPSSKMKVEKAYFAAGCFWGVEYYLERAKGVVATTVGYMGGMTKNPTYRQVSAGGTGHIETVEVVYDPLQTDFESLARLFFEIHDPTQTDRQGPDIGEQYRGAIFYLNDGQKNTAEKLIRLLRNKGLNVVTKLEAAPTFWKAEDYHQQYYDNNGKQPYCHAYTKRF